MSLSSSKSQSISNLSNEGSLQELLPAELRTRSGKTELPPSASYTKLSESLRKSTPPEVQCSLFCGGKRCRYETAKRWSSDDKALPGIYSHW